VAGTHHDDLQSESAHLREMYGELVIASRTA
jgi:hypothetical protein